MVTRQPGVVKTSHQREAKCSAEIRLTEENQYDAAN
jgi:hypothetical protein